MRLTASGQSRKSAAATAGSALPSEADIGAVFRHVSFVPKPEVAFTRGLIPKSVAKAAGGGCHTATCDASQGSSTILPPSPPASIRAWTFFAAASGSRPITTG
jgi:hypothetical protein